MGHVDLHAQNPGRQAPRDGDGPQAPGHHRHPARATGGLPGQRRTRGQTTTGSPVRWHPPQTAEEGSPRRSPTRPGYPADAAAANCSPAYAPAGATCASNEPRCKCTRSPSSPTLSRRDSRSHCGCSGWPGCGARRSSCAHPATTESTTDNLPTRPRSSHWRARCRDNRHGGFGPGAAGKGPVRHLASGLPVRCQDHDAQEA